MITVKRITEYLSEHISDPAQKYIMVKEIHGKHPSSSAYLIAYNGMKQSKWYRELAAEQWEDGSWGMFHTMDAKAEKKPRFLTTEAALGRAHELSLPKDDPIIVKAAELLERYARGEETWRDRIEMHKDNGKGHMYCRPFMSAAQLGMFDPDNSAIRPLLGVVANKVETAFSSGTFDGEFWDREVREYRVPVIAHPGNMYGSMLLQCSGCLDDNLQRLYLEYMMNSENGIYYVSRIPLSDKQTFESGNFRQWLGMLELLSGFTLFPKLIGTVVLPHLLNETERIINDEVVLDNHKTRYAEDWRNKDKRKTDAVLRIARLLAKC